MEFTNISSDNKFPLYKTLLTQLHNHRVTITTTINRTHMVHSNVLMHAYILPQDFGDQPNIYYYKHFRYIWITLGCDMYITSPSTISCMYTITHTHHSESQAHTCVCMYASKHVCKQACMYTHVRTHKHTRTHAHTQTHTNTHHDYNSNNKMQTIYICSVEKSSPSMPLLQGI